MKNFFKKINKNPDDEQDSLNLDYGDFYMGRSERPDDRRPDDRRYDDRRPDDRRYDDRRYDDRRYDDRRPEDRAEPARRVEPAEERSTGGYYDVPRNPRGTYEEPDFRSESPRYYGGEVPADRPVERPVDRAAESADGSSYVRPRETWQEADAPGYRPARNEEPQAPDATPVFTPAPAPEYLYFTPSTYRDCREGIVKGLATGHVVVVRLRKLEANDVLRLFDYMMGAVLALEGETVRPAATTVVLVPKDVELNESEIEPDDDEILPEDDSENEDSEEEIDGEETDCEDEYNDEEYDEEEYEEDEYDDEEYADEEYADDEEYDDEDDEEYDDEDEYDEEYDDEYDDEYDEEYDEEYDDEGEYDEEYDEKYDDEDDEDKNAK